MRLTLNLARLRCERVVTTQLDGAGTFSKAFRLAALRVGYAIAHPELIVALENPLTLQPP